MNSTQRLDLKYITKKEKKKWKSIFKDIIRGNRLLSEIYYEGMVVEGEVHIVNFFGPKQMGFGNMP